MTPILVGAPKRRSLIVIAIIGIIAVQTGLAHFDEANRIAHLFESLGWTLLAVIAVRAAIIFLCTMGWRLLLADSLPIGTLFRLRLVREGFNVLLPVASVGGEVVAARLLDRVAGAPGSGAASVLADLLVQSVAQLLFTVLGTAVLLSTGRGGALVAWLLPGLALASAGLAGFLIVQRGGVGLAERILQRAVQAWTGANGSAWQVQAALDDIYRRKSALAGSLVVHSAAWLLGTAEIYVVLAALGHPVTLPEALVIESLVQAVRGAAFVVPAGVGVQEAGFVVLAGLFGVPLDAAIALSLAKRTPDFALGGLGLLMWGQFERRRHALQPASSQS